MIRVRPVILVGGKSRRFGSDKFFLSIKGNRIFERTYRILKDTFLVEPVFIGRQAPLPNYQFISDLIPGLGPIGGLYTAFKVFEEDFVFLVACDMPLIKKAVLEYMFESLNPEKLIYIPKLCNDFIEPLFAFYNRKLLSKVEENIRNGEFRLRSLIEDSYTQYLQCSEIVNLDPELLTFLNINTKSDFDKILEIIEDERRENLAI